MVRRLPTTHPVSKLIYGVLRDVVPFMYKGQLKSLLVANSDEREAKAGEYREWKKAKARLAHKALGPLLEAGQIRKYSVTHYRVGTIEQAEPVVSWAPGERRLDAADSIERISACKAAARVADRRELEVYFVPSNESRSALDIPFFETTIRGAENKTRGTRSEHEVIALRLASIYISQLLFYRESAETFELNPEYKVGQQATPPEAFVTRNSLITDVFASTDWREEAFSKLMDRQMAASRPFEIW